jgi:predicted ATPase with chaperone activity
MECHLSSNLLSILIVGFASKSVDETKERRPAAFSNSSPQLPQKRITISPRRRTFQKTAAASI